MLELLVVGLIPTWESCAERQRDVPYFPILQFRTAPGRGPEPCRRLRIAIWVPKLNHQRLDLDMPAASCAFCNHANAAGSKFCSECGAALRLTLCPVCEAVNDRTFTKCYKCGADLYASAIFAQTAPGQAGTQPDIERVEATREVAAELSVSAPFAPNDMTNEVADEVANEAAGDMAIEAASERRTEDREWELTALADAPSEGPLSGYRWRPSNPTPELDVMHPQSTVPESAARALEVRSAADTPLTREALATTPPIREPVTAPRTRTTSMPFAILGIVVIAVAVYYGYRNDSFAPAIAWLNSTPAYKSLERWAGAWGAGNRGADPAQTPVTTAAAPDTSDNSAPSPPVEDSTAQAPAAAATSAASSGDDTPSPASTPSAQLPTQSPTPPPAEQLSPAPDDAASAKAPAHCSDAATAMGLCNPDKSSEGK